MIDNNGNKTVYKKNTFVDIVVEDESGATIGTLKKDIFGNTVLEKRCVDSKDIFDKGYLSRRLC